MIISGVITLGPREEKSAMVGAGFKSNFSVGGTRYAIGFLRINENSKISTKFSTRLNK